MRIIAKIMRKNSQHANLAVVSHTMDWSNLSYFLTLARSGSLSAASQVLGTDHSTVARRIQALEKDLGLQLVDRRIRAYSLTSSGEHVAELSERVESAIGDIERYAQVANCAPHGVVRVSGPPVMITLIAPGLTRLQSQFPGLRFELIGESREASLTRREADIALRLYRPREESLVARKLKKINYGLYGSKDHLDARQPADWDFLAQGESRDGTPQHQWLKTIAGGKEFALRANDPVTLLGAVRAGLGLAVLPAALVWRDKALKKVPTPTPVPSRDLWLVFHRDVGKAPAIRAAINHLTAIFKAGRTLESGSA